MMVAGTMINDHDNGDDSGNGDYDGVVVVMMIILVVPVEKDQGRVPRHKAITIGLHLKLFFYQPQYTIFRIVHNKSFQVASYHLSNCLRSTDPTQARSRKTTEVTDLGNIFT